MSGMKVLPPLAYVGSLACPDPCRGELEISGGYARCRSCGEAFAIGDDAMLEFVREAGLDEETARELRAHDFSATSRQVEQFVRKERAMMWRSYYSRNRMLTMQYLARFLERVDCSRLIFLGAGTGREIEYLLSFRKLQTVLCSDLSRSALRIIPARLAEYDLELGLFSSDLQRCPVAGRDIPVVVVNALHHTSDMHAVLEGLLDNQYENLFIVEPTDNFMIRLFAGLGLARRREYSGVLPGRLELPRLKAMCRRYGYRLQLRTAWEFPSDYYRKLFGKPGMAQGVFFRLLKAFSLVTGVVQLGNFSVVHMSKLPVAKDGVVAIPHAGAGR